MLSRLLLARSIRNHANEDSGDPYWANVVSLLHFDGGDGTTALKDEVLGRTWTTGTGISLSTDPKPLFFPTSLLMTGAGSISTVQGLGTQDVTIECFVKYSGSVVRAGLIGWQTISSYRNRCVIQPFDSATIEWTIEGTAGWQGVSVAGLNITLDVWHHMAVTRQGTTLRMFLDGVLIATGTKPIVNITSTDLSIGRVYSGNANRYLNARVAEARVTVGICRYTEDFPMPTEPFPNRGL